MPTTTVAGRRAGEAGRPFYRAPSPTCRVCAPSTAIPEKAAASYPPTSTKRTATPRGTTTTDATRPATAIRRSTEAAAVCRTPSTKRKTTTAAPSKGSSPKPKAPVKPATEESRPATAKRAEAKPTPSLATRRPEAVRAGRAVPSGAGSEAKRGRPPTTQRYPKSPTDLRAVAVPADLDAAQAIRQAPLRPAIRAERRQRCRAKRAVGLKRRRAAVREPEPICREREREPTLVRKERAAATRAVRAATEEPATR